MADKNVVEIILKAVDKATKPIQEINRSLNKALAPTKAISNQFAALEKASGIKQISKAFSEVGNSVGNLKNQIVGTATTVLTTAGLIGGAFAFVAKSTIESADALLSLSKETGVSVEGLQRLQFIADQSGSSAEDLSGALKKFTVNMGMARAGQGTLFSIMSKVNPVMLNQMLHAKSNEEAFKLMLGVIEKLPKAQQQAALSQVAFGRGALSMISVAKAGSAEYDRLGARIEKIGIITTAQAEQANATADAWGELWTALKAARDAVMIMTLPALQELAKTLTEFLIENKDEIKAWGKEFAKRLPDILNGVIGALKVVGRILGPLSSLFAFLGKHTTILNLALALLAEIMALRLIYSIWGVVKAVLALNGAMLMNPVGLVIIGITALIVALVLLYTYWDDVVGIWKEAIKVAENYITKIAEAISWTKQLPASIMTKLGFSTEDVAVSGGAKGAPASDNRSETSVKVSFDNLPKGARVSSVSKQDYLDLSLGYAMQ